MSTYDNDKLKKAIMDMVEPASYRDVLYGGCASGSIGQLVYYSQTVKFHDEHQTAIWDLVYEDMRNIGESDNLMEFIASWNGAKNVTSMEDFKNLMTWYAAETVVRWLSEELEEHDIDAQDEEATAAFYKEQAEQAE